MSVLCHNIITNTVSKIMLHDEVVEVVHFEMHFGYKLSDAFYKHDMERLKL